MNDKHENDLNRDPISGTPGAHPVGTGVGAVAGGATGAAIGAAGGPVGVVAGAVVGAVAGGLAGKGIGESINPTAEEAYWRGQYENEPYYARDRSYEDYAPAYRTGYEARARYQGKRYEEIEHDLKRDYETGSNEIGSNQARLAWDDARHATRAAWDRLERAVPGDADRDGK